MAVNPPAGGARLASGEIRSPTPAPGMGKDPEHLGGGEGTEAEFTTTTNPEDLSIDNRDLFALKEITRATTKQGRQNFWGKYSHTVVNSALHWEDLAAWDPYDNTWVVTDALVRFLAKKIKGTEKQVLKMIDVGDAPGFMEEIVESSVMYHYAKEAFEHIKDKLPAGTRDTWRGYLEKAGRRWPEGKGS